MEESNEELVTLQHSWLVNFSALKFPVGTSCRKNGFNDRTNAPRLHQLQHLVIPRRKKHAQHVVREFTGSQSFLEEMDNEVVRNGRQVVEALDVEHGRDESQVQKRRRGRHTEERERELHKVQVLV